MLSIKRILKVLDPIQRSVFYFYLLIPLLTYIPINRPLSRSLRIFLYLGLALLFFGVPKLRQVLGNNFSSLRNYVKVPLMVIMFAIVISSFVAFTKGVDVFEILFGVSPDYLGLVTWLLFIILGIGLQDSVRKYLFSNLSLAILFFSMLVGLLWEIYYIRMGFRLSGIMYQSTTLAMYACIGLVISLQQMTKQKSIASSSSGALSSRDSKILIAATFFISIATIIFSQSRGGYVVMLIVLSLWVVKHVRSALFWCLLLTCFITALVILPKIESSYFTRLTSSSVSKGIDYRMDLYNLTIKENIDHPKIIGDGPNALPVYINNQTKVPEEIAKTLQDGELFGSTHDLYFDFMYLFGFIAAISLIYLTGMSVIRGFKNDRSLLLIFGVLIFNALLNVPSLELTSLYFIVMIALYYGDNHKKQLQQH